MSKPDTERSISRSLSHQFHQGVHRNDTVGLHDQRIDLGFGDDGIVDARKLRQGDDRLRQRFAITGGLAAITGKHAEHAHFADHLVRFGKIDR